MQHHNNMQEKPPKIIRMENNLSPKNHKNTNPKLNPKEITSHPKNNPSDPKMTPQVGRENCVTRGAVTNIDSLTFLWH
jgi:hypothetical protein